MEESDFNSLLTRSFRAQGGWAYKPPDPTYFELKTGNASKRPFDIFGVLAERPFYIESKFLPGYQAFSFSMIKEHQLDNLTESRPAFGDTGFCGIALAVYLPYKYYDAFFFDINFINERIARGDKSIKRDELQTYKERGLFMPVSGKQLVLAKIPEVKINVIAAAVD